MAQHLKPSLVLTHAGALAIVEAAIAKAEEIQAPQCIAVVDAGGNLLAFVRMDGAKVLSQHTATQRATTRRCTTSGLTYVSSRLFGSVTTSIRPRATTDAAVRSCTWRQNAGTSGIRAAMS